MPGDPNSNQNIKSINKFGTFWKIIVQSNDELLKKLEIHSLLWKYGHALAHFIVLKIFQGSFWCNRTIA